MTDYAPLVPNFPQLQSNVNTRVNQVTPFLNQLPSPLPLAYAQIQNQRLQRGQAPWSLAESVYALEAARRQQAVTKKPKRSPWSPSGIFSNIRHDLGAILSSLPHLPGALIGEVMSLPQLPQALAQATQAGNIGNVIQQISQAPGIRFIPGAYTVGNIAGGTPGQLAEHPLFTGLDILPAAGKVAGATKVGRVAVEEAAKIGARPRALRALATRTFDESGNLIPNRPATAVTRMLETSGAGRFGLGAWGQKSREGAGLAAFEEEGIREILNPDMPLPKNATWYQKESKAAAELVRDSAEVIPEDRWIELNDIGQSQGRSGLLSNATPEELPFINRWLNITDNFRAGMAADDTLAIIGNEAYPVGVGSRFLRAQERATSLDAKVQTKVLPKLEEIQSGLTIPDPRIDTVIQAIKVKDYSTAAREMSFLYRRRTAIQSPSRVGTLAGPVAQTQLASLKNWSILVARARGAARHAERLMSMSEAVPARFVSKIMESEVLPRVEKLTRDKLARQLQQGIISQPLHDAKIEQLVTAVSRQFIDDVPDLTNTELNSIMRDAAKEWKRLRDEGFDPPYVHVVSPERAYREINYPRIRISEYKPSAEKPRLLDFTPTVKNPMIALTHLATEQLLKHATTDFLDEFEKVFGKSLEDVRVEFRGVADRRYERDPSHSYSSHLQRLIDRKYEKYDRESFMQQFGHKAPTGMEAIRDKAIRDAMGRPDVYIPRYLADNLRRMKQYNSEGFHAITDPLLNVFRTSVLALSPRFHTNNLVGGAIVTAGQTNPLTVWFKLGESLRLLKNREELPVKYRRTLGGTNRDTIEFNYLGGKTSRRLWDQLQNYFAANGRDGIAGMIGKARKAGNTLVKGSFNLNAWVDDLYRTMGYLYGKSKAERRGLTGEAAEQAGIELARRTLQQWHEITPIERSLLRSIIPFYGFASFILRYTMKFPFDHPIRTSILNSVARAELEDLGTGLPQSYLDFITFGGTDKFGNQRGVSTRGLNPFTDVADMFTLSGWVGQVNPLISTALQGIGIDPISAQAELYPNLRYDPSTGHLYQEQGNYALRTLNNLIPQSRILAEMMGMSNEFKELLANNPESARRLLQSQAGIPVNYRNLNRTQELMKQEVRRFQSQQDAFNEALGTGTDTHAREYPALRARLDQLRQLQSAGALTAFTPEQNIPSLPSLLSPLPRRP